MHLAQVGLLPMWTNSETDVQAAFREDLAGILSERASEDEKRQYAALFDVSESDLLFLDQLSIAVGAAALLHDVGHTPYSHALEPFYDAAAEWICGEPSPGLELLTGYRSNDQFAGREFHEVVGLIIADRIEQDLSDHPDTLPWTLIRSILHSRRGETSCVGALHEYISGEVDVDRIDYLLRDSNNSGTGFGSFDATRLLDSLAIYHNTGQTEIDSGWMIGYGSHALPALEDFIQCRYQYYRRVALHNKVFGFNRLLDIGARLLHQLHVSGELAVRDAPRNLDYIPVPSTVDDQSLHGDDNDVAHWFKASIPLCKSDNSDENRSPQAKRFYAVGKAILQREGNWISLWKSDHDYLRISEHLHMQLKARIVNCEFVLERAIEIAGMPRGQAARGLGTLVQLKDTYIAHKPLDPDVSEIPPFGATALMNEIGRVVLKDDSGVRSWESREMRAADHLGDLCSSSLMDLGFWVLGHRAIVAARGGFQEDHAAQVYENGKVIRLTERSGHFVTRLANVEAARPQFRCYFVSTSNERVDPILVRQEFISNFPQFVEETITALILPQ